MKSGSDEQPAPKGDIEESSSISVVGLPQSRWRTVEVAASFHQTGMPAGGGFLLRDSNGKSALFVEASALHEAIQKIIDQDLMGPQGVAFCFESEKLFTELSFPEDDACPIIECCMNLMRVMHDKIRLCLKPGEDLTAAIWLAEHGRICCKPRCQWDNQGSWPPELAELLGPAQLYSE